MRLLHFELEENLFVLWKNMVAGWHLILFELWLVRSMGEGEVGVIDFSHIAFMDKYNLEPLLPGIHFRSDFVFCVL